MPSVTDQDLMQLKATRRPFVADQGFSLTCLRFHPDQDWRRFFVAAKLSPKAGLVRDDGHRTGAGLVVGRISIGDR